ncbi:isoaspartyl peptidase/L-asparaginase [Sphingomonas naphthae]|uniref:Isoaspartyl peptidase/L-asparaginase n=1 Tax=Sphingomonas naphthae TaxID=1813468 RepID=A0ABY7TJY2_9SPHN|nr:isoaspartyl peptidase/L-asparaginase [Sphingomonas naphthae]WCT73520.1 isoaspartyl peptidase/L-asparaginase [Sphingomonas naphthae]
MQWTLVIHGGAGRLTRDTVSPDQESAIRAALTAALDAGAAILDAGGPALDAVAAAVRVLEDDPHFNSGRGAALTQDGRIEHDAAIMDGATRDAGAVAGVTTTRHPVDLARTVMERSPHVLLSGAGADRFSRDQGLEQAEPAWFEVAERRRQLTEMLARDPDAFDVDMKYGTVGAVAVDAAGHLAAATSTGGVTGKRWGRIGDSPSIGAGTWADDRACAVSCTGSGEHFIRAGVAHGIAARVRLLGENVVDAAGIMLAEAEALGGRGGAIVVTPAGEAGWALTTAGMHRGIRRAGEAGTVAIFGEEG